MKIKFDTATMTEAEARGLSAMLAAMFPPSVVDRHPAPIQIRQIVDVSEHVEKMLAERAPDGYPVEAEQPTEYERSDKISHVGPNERDTAGIPWDERIHASTKTTNKDGTWTRRRNTPDEVFDKVMAELKAANTAMTLEAATSGGLIDKVGTLEMGIPEPPAAPSAAEAFTPPASVAVPPVPVAVPQPPVPPTPPVPSVPVAPPADDKAAEPVEIMKALNAKQVPADKLAAVLGKAGLKGLAEVFTATIDARRIIAAELAAL